MEPWYKVATSRKEVREGRSFNPDEFAIALELFKAEQERGPDFLRLARFRPSARRGARRSVCETRCSWRCRGDGGEHA